MRDEAKHQRRLKIATDAKVNSNSYIDLHIVNIIIDANSAYTEY